MNRGRRIRRKSILAGAALSVVVALALSASRASTSSLTYDFVFSSITIDSHDAPVAAGFNLDGLYSTTSSGTGCHVPDRRSDLDPDQNLDSCMASEEGCVGGVDNVLPLLADAIDDSLKGMDSPVRERLSALLLAGRIVILLRVEGVDDLTNDSDVTVHLYHGYSADTSCAALFAGSGQFYIANDSLTVSGDPSSSLWHASGSIVDGRLRVRYGGSSSLAAEAPSGFPINQLAMRFDLNSTGSAGTNGNAGGWLLGSTLRMLSTIAFPKMVAIFNGIIPQIDDLPGLSSGLCGGRFGMPEGGAGIGYRFALQQATILGTASSHPTATCGAP